MTDSKVTAARSKAYLDALTRFLGTPLEDLVFRQNDGSPNPEAAQKNALRMFSLASSEINGVPAYKEFLKAQGVDASKIDRFDAWDTVPWVEKSNYVNLYPLSNRSFAGTMSDFDVLHVSSGSGGKPTAWGRVAMDELFIAQRFEQVFRNSFKADQTKTLAINMLPLGTWVGGLFTFQCVRNLSLKGYDVTSISTGVDVGEILRVIRELGPLYDSVVVLAYPPFFKTVVDAGNRAGIPWPSYNIKCVFAGEVFSESWRDLLMQRAGITSPSHIVSIYGTADGGVLGCESPLSTAIRRFFASKPEVARKIFGKDRLPSLMQYDPCQRMIELTPEDTLAFSTLVPSDWSGEGHGPYAAGVLAPLIRYNIGDAGGIKPFDEMMAFCRENGFDPVPEAEKMGGDRAVVKMPFVWVFGRRFWTVSLYGANVYLENLMHGIEHPEIAHRVTGKLVLGIEEDASLDPFLSVVVELDAREKLDEMSQDEVTALETEIARLLRMGIERENSEFAHYVPEDKRTPKVVVKPFGEETYFKQGVKHKWIQGQ